MKKMLVLVLMLAVASGALAQESAKKYAIKSAAAKTMSITGDHETPGVLYFDDYGEKEILSQTIEIPGLVTYDGVAMNIGDKVYIFNVQDGKRSDAKRSDHPLYDLNFLNLTDEVKAKYQVEEVGADEWLGKPCKLYTYVTIQNRRKCTWKAWVYKGFILRSESKIGRRNVLYEVREFQENAPVPAGTFDIPKVK